MPRNCCLLHFMGITVDFWFISLKELSKVTRRKRDVIRWSFPIKNVIVGLLAGKIGEAICSRKRLSWSEPSLAVISSNTNTDNNNNNNSFLLTLTWRITLIIGDVPWKSHDKSSYWVHEQTSLSTWVWSLSAYNLSGIFFALQLYYEFTTAEE